MNASAGATLRDADVSLARGQRVLPSDHDPREDRFAVILGTSRRSTTTETDQDGDQRSHCSTMDRAKARFVSPAGARPEVDT